LQRTEPGGSIFSDVTGGISNVQNLLTSLQVTGLEKRQVYRFRYRTINEVGPSDWSPESFLVPAVPPSAPETPQFISASDDEILIRLGRSQDDGGSLITDYELWIDQGSINSVFTQVTAYDYNTHFYEFAVNKDDNLLTPGLTYSFKVRS
jgi:hypothetical protein